MATDGYHDDDGGYDDILPVTDKEAAKGYLRRYDDESKKYNANYDAIMKRRQDAISQVRSTIDDTIAEMRAKQSGAGAGQINLPLLALGAGLLSPEPGGRIGNFGSELSRGLTAMGSTIQKQRMGDSEFLKGIADLQRASGTMGDHVMKDEATNEMRKAMQADALRGKLETALTKAQLGTAGRTPADERKFQLWQQSPGNEGKSYDDYLKFVAANSARTPADERLYEVFKQSPGNENVSYEEYIRRKSGAQQEGKTRAKSQAEADIALPGAEFNLDTMLGTIDRVQNHPGKLKSLGLNSMLPNIPGGEAENFANQLSQLTGQAFLTQFDKMRGAGQITEIEGKKATDALMNLSTRLSPKEFDKNIGVLRDILEKQRAIMRQKAGKGAPPMPGAKQAPDGKWYLEKDGKYFRVGE